MSLYAEDNGIGYEEVQGTTSVEVMVEYAKEGVIDNNRTNDGNFEDWDDGRHIASVYLNHCDNPVPDAVIEALDKWIAEKKEEETSEPEIFVMLDADGNVRVLHDEDADESEIDLE